MKEKATETIQIKLTPSEHMRIKELATQHQVPVSTIFMQGIECLQRALSGSAFTPMENTPSRFFKRGEGKPAIQQALKELLEGGEVFGPRDVATQVALNLKLPFVTFDAEVQQQFEKLIYVHLQQMKKKGELDWEIFSNAAPGRRSTLDQYRDQIVALDKEGCTLQGITRKLFEDHGLQIDGSTLSRFLKKNRT